MQSSTFTGKYIFMKQLPLLCLSYVLMLLAACTRTTIDLSGEWQFSMGDVPEFTDRITLPGSMLTNGKGYDVTVDTRWTGSTYDSSYYYSPHLARYREEGNVKYPFFLTPDKYYVGNAWYRRTVRVPSAWEGRPVTLYLERPHIETTLFVNGREVGHQMSLSTPHQYDISEYVAYGDDNELVICVYNGIENVCVGQDSHSVTDQTQGNWNGIVGTIELRSAPVINRVRAVPDVAAGVVRIEVNEARYALPLGKDTCRWSEFNPQLYTRTVDYQGTPVEVTFGIRDIRIEGPQFYLNDHPIWLRGTLENCCFPETGYAPMDVAAWQRVFEKCREYGLNHVRFHSWCPPEAAFAAADRVGIYLQPEGPSWPNHGVRLRSGQYVDTYLMEETKRIIDTYGHHPSFVMFALGNEPAGRWVEYCNDWVSEMMAYDSTRVYCGASVGGGWAWDSGSQFHVKGGGRGLNWTSRAPQSADDYLADITFPRHYYDTVPNSAPIIAHEQGQWCAFPDFKEIPQYTGAYKAHNFEIFRDLLADAGMAHRAESFLYASGKLQAMAYKFENERNLRTPGYAGFQLLGLNDYSGQGSALVGVLNVHWREKGYCTADEWRESCSSIVPLARFPKFVYTDTEQLDIPIEIYHAGAAPIDRVQCAYVLSGLGEEIRGSLPLHSLPVSKNIPAGYVVHPLAPVSTPAKATLTVTINDEDRVVARNHWDFWVYPDSCAMPTADDVYIAEVLDAQALSVLEQGGKVLLTSAGKITYGSDIVQHYLPVFWNTSWFKMRPPHTTGAAIDATHPLFAHGFPTDDWSNLNWWELLNKAQVVNLADFPVDYQSPIQPIDTWHISRKLGMLVEANVSGGKLLLTTMDITRDLEHRVVARQMRSAILSYMQSPDFAPTLTVTPEVIADLYTKQAPRVDMYTNGSPDELKPAIVR